jgi:antitoxin (DNA-binding transcriptional repressor) of toxin-antitoxin stability system
METMTISAARVAFPEMLKWVHDGEEVTITRHGRPVAVVVRPDVLAARRVQDEATNVAD